MNVLFMYRYPNTKNDKCVDVSSKADWHAYKITMDMMEGNPNI
jgi:hypothetical protein